MFRFLGSSAGKGTAGVCACCVILVFPPMASWLFATFALAFGVHHLGEAFRSIDAELAAAKQRRTSCPDDEAALAVLARGDTAPAAGRWNRQP